MFFILSVVCGIGSGKTIKNILVFQNNLRQVAEKSSKFLEKERKNEKKDKKASQKMSKNDIAW